MNLYDSDSTVSNQVLRSLFFANVIKYFRKIVNFSSILLAVDRPVEYGGI